MKIQSLVTFFLGFTLLLSGISWSATPGIYIGGDLGYSRMETPDSQAFSPVGASLSNSRNQGGVGGILFAGYAFNPYLAVEAGYLYPAESKYEASQGSQNASLKYNSHVAKLTGKLNLPLRYGWEVFGEAGVGSVWQRVDYSNPGKIPVNGRFFVEPKSGGHTYWQSRALVGAGVRYYLNDSWAIHGVWNMVNMPAHFSSDQEAVASIQFIGAGIEYCFGT